jgi:hypothetical protein
MSAERAVTIKRRSRGAGGVGLDVVYESRMPDGGWPWAVSSVALAPVPASGKSFINIKLVKGDGIVWPMVAPARTDPEQSVWRVGGHVLFCDVRSGGVYLDGSRVRGEPGLAGDMAPGETLRVGYEDKTRMVSVERRGRSYDLCALPADYDPSEYRFGVIVTSGNTVRLTGASEAAGVCARACAAWRGVRACVRACVRETAVEVVRAFARNVSCAHNFVGSCAHDLMFWNHVRRFMAQIGVK